MRVCLPELLWYGSTTLEIDLPENWDVEICPMRGAGRTPLSLEQMEKAILNPIGSPAIRELAQGKKSAVIIFDDITRPTRPYELAPIVIQELLAGGIAEEDITFVCALGTHGAHTNHDFRKKLGSDILERFRVFNHNIYENCVEAGTTSRGTKLMVNREVMEADLKIGIGCVTAHAQAGFSGGGKIILPGVAHIDSITHYHLEVEAQARETTGLGNFDNNILRFDIEEAVRLSGLDFKIDVVVNDRGLATAVFAGDVLEQHAEAVKLAKDVYAADPRPRDKNVVIANAFAKANEMGIAVLLGALSLDNFTGTVVIIANAPEGQVPHYLCRSFGRNYGGRQYPMGVIPDSLDIMVVGPQVDRNFADWVSNPEVITWFKTWPDALTMLKDKFGSGTRAAVFPNATMQYLDS